jgi:hypothetical protein
MRFLHGWNGVTLRYRQQNEDIRNVFEVSKITNDIKEYQEKWKSHVRPMPDYRLPRRIFNNRWP